MTDDHAGRRGEIAREMATSLKKTIREMAACGHHRSAQASLTELAIEVGGFKRLLADPAQLTAALAAAREQDALPVQIPEAATLTVPTDQFELAGRQVFVLNGRDAGQPVVIYLAGGAYFQRPLKLHWEFCDRLAQATGARILLACYPLTPANTFTAAYDFLGRLYAHVYATTPASRITIMGDSAGAGLAAGFCEQLGQEGGPQPGHLVLISPWLDLDLTNPQIPTLAKRDVMLAPSGLRRIAADWAGETAHQDFRLSPLNGPVDHLRAVSIYVGTDEIMCPAAMAYTERLRAAGVPVTCHLGRRLFHVYPLYPIPEGEEVIAELTRLLNQPATGKDD